MTSPRLDEDEAWAMIESAEVGVLSTLRTDGWPVALPVWFVSIDRVIYVRTALASAKARRIARDPRAGFLVEAGTRWRDLRAVSLRVEARLVPDTDEQWTAALAAIGDKYREHREHRRDLPAKVVRGYDQRGTAVVELRPAGPPLAWDNRRVALSPSAVPDEG